MYAQERISSHTSLSRDDMGPIFEYIAQVAKLEARTHGRKWAAQHRQALWGDPAASQTGSSSNNNKSSGEEEEGGKRESIGPPIFGDGGDGSNGSSSHNDDDILALSLVPSFLGGDVRVRGDGAVSLLDKHGKPLVRLYTYLWHPQSQYSQADACD